MKPQQFRSHFNLNARFHMPLNLRSIIKRATKPTPWHFSDEQLYKLCHENPLHAEAEVVLAKILLIGRVYAAAIERRKSDLDKPNDEFYIQRVAPIIMESSIDRWIEKSKKHKPGTLEALAVMLETHGRTTALFSRISGLEKRSLASKYLHFHVPNLFFIYDSRAIEGMRKVGDIVGIASPYKGKGDHEYAKFAEKCVRLSRACESDFGCKMNPRKIDNLLLILSEKRNLTFVPTDCQRLPLNSNVSIQPDKGKTT